MSEPHPTPEFFDPTLDDDLTDVDADTPPPEGAGPAAGPEDFEPDDPDPEASQG